MASVIPLNAVFLGILAKARERTLKSTDSRVKLTNEVLQVRPNASPALLFVSWRLVVVLDVSFALLLPKQGAWIYARGRIPVFWWPLKG
jgi:hypothetical protein